MREHRLEAKNTLEIKQAKSGAQGIHRTQAQGDDPPMPGLVPKLEVRETQLDQRT